LPAEIIVPDAADVLIMVHRLGCREADVSSEGEYRFSVRLDDNGLWYVFQRENAGEAKVLPLAG